MISFIELRNFQSHQNSHLDFHPGVNVITGTTDSGKTAIIRGLRWLVWGRPLGDGFRSNWGGVTSINIKTKEGSIINRTKDKSDSYQLNDTIFKAFGTVVPEEIQKAIDIVDVNLQYQLDSPFLISETAGDVANHFSKIANLEKIHQSQKEIKRLLNKLLNTAEYKEQEIVSQSDALSELEYLGQLEKEIEVLEAFQQKKDAIDRAVLSLSLLITKTNTQLKKIEDFQPLIALESEVTRILALYEEKNELIKVRSRLLSALNKLSNTNDAIQQKNTIIAADQLVNNTLQLFTRHKDAVLRYKQLNALIETTKRNKILIAVTLEKIKNLSLEFDTMFPDICPLCGKPKNTEHEKNNHT